MTFTNITSNKNKMHIWTKMFLDLGHHGFTDKNGYGVIHENEPTQAVFFSSKFIKHIDTIYYNDIGKNAISKIDDEHVFAQKINTLTLLLKNLKSFNLERKIEPNFFLETLFDPKSKVIYLNSGKQEFFTKSQNIEIYSIEKLERLLEILEDGIRKRVKITSRLIKQETIDLMLKCCVNTECKDYLNKLYNPEKKRFVKIGYIDSVEKFIKYFSKQIDMNIRIKRIPNFDLDDCMENTTTGSKINFPDDDIVQIIEYVKLKFEVSWHDNFKLYDTAEYLVEEFHEYLRLIKIYFKRNKFSFNENLFNKMEKEITKKFLTKMKNE